MKILLEVPVSMSSGYGKDGIGLTRALVERGHQVTLAPPRVQVPLPVDIANRLSVEHYQDPPYDVRITHTAPQDVGLSEADAALAKTNIFWSMWEWFNYPQEFAEAFTAGVAHYDWVVTYDETSHGALAPLAPQPEDHKVVVQGGYESEDWRPNPAGMLATTAQFLFGTMGDLSVRKNPVVLIKAYRMFRDAYPDSNTGLILKSRHPILGPSHGPFIIPEENILEINGVWDRKQVEGFFYSLGAYVAPSFGEGKNLPALEAATCGVPLILSDVAGHRSWGSLLDSAVLVPGERAGVRMSGIPVYGVRVDEGLLAEAMGHVYETRVRYHAQARTNVPTVVGSMDWYRVVERLGLVVNVPWL